ncbi:MAG: helix-turn-helix domain-containing protein [Firmicutes bacterium]|nr:helix-turn-helix domain-containing protein [Bacillota bacterium]
MENFSNRLKQLRENSGISVTELAREIGVDHSNISNWESGKQKINADNLYKLAQFFEVSMEYLLGH